MLSIVEIDKLEDVSSFLQSEFWANFKTLHGWQRNFFSATYEDEEKMIRYRYSFQFVVLFRPISFFGSLAYVPMLPDCFEEASNDDMAIFRKRFLFQLSSKLFDLLKKDVFLIRFDVAWKVEIENRGGTGSKKMEVVRPNFLFGRVNSIKIVKAFYDVQPPDTVVLDLNMSEGEILSQLKSKCRYNIKLAEKRGCVIECINMKDEEEIKNGIHLFYPLYRETAKRDGIAIHNMGYYTSLFLEALKYQNISLNLYVAKYEDECLAAIITIFYRDGATYLYGASSNEHRNLMPTYLLQYRAIMDAKKAGCKMYDFYGIPPVNDESHPMAGLYRFKTGFGGKIVHRIGSIDAYKNIFIYFVYSTAERIRSFYFKKLKKIFSKKNKDKN